MAEQHDIVFVFIEPSIKKKFEQIRVKLLCHLLLKGLKVLDFSTLLPGPFANVSCGYGCRSDPCGISNVVQIS